MRLVDDRPSLPGEPPRSKPNQPLSAATHRLYDRWGRYGDSASEFYTTFRYSLLPGLGPEPGVTRRDPTAVVHAAGRFHAWYTRRAGGDRDAGNQARTGHTQRRDVAAYDWDLAEIWHATSADGITWREQGRAVARGPRDAFDGRSVFTPGILVWRGRYYLYYQAVAHPYGTRTRNVVGMAWADAPEGPWHRHGEPVLTPGMPGEWRGDEEDNAVTRYGAWDSHKVHDPQPLVRDGKVWLYYKGQPMGWGTGGDGGIGWGVATADRPEGPFVKSPLNPVTNSGHETLLFPYRGGVTAICNHDGPEKDTVQYAPDGLNFKVKAHVVLPPPAGAPYAPDLFADNRDGRGITWGLAHLAREELKHGNSYLVRFDCNLSRDVERPGFRRSNHRFPESVYFSPDLLFSGATAPEARPAHTVRPGHRGSDAGAGAKPGRCEPDHAGTGPEPPAAPVTADAHRSGPAAVPAAAAAAAGAAGAAEVAGGTDRSPRRTPRPAVGHDPRPDPLPPAAADDPDAAATRGDPVSAATRRVREVYGAAKDQGSEFFSAFKYTPVTGVGKQHGVSRRDPTKVIRVGGTYYVWYTRRQSPAPAGFAGATETVPVWDWDLGELWYATSADGLAWEERGRAVARGPRGAFDDRSVLTPDILVWKGRYYLYYQVLQGPYRERSLYQIGMAHADSPDGPWQRWPEPVLRPGEPAPELAAGSEDPDAVTRFGAWDSHKLHDPFLLVRGGRIWLYYKGVPFGRHYRHDLGCQWGVAIADRPEGPFARSPLNPVTNSGHETLLYPYREGVVAITSLEGPEKNTVQYAADGLNFEVVGKVSAPPVAAGPHVPDAFTDTRDGEGITWGLAHLHHGPHGTLPNSYLVRFECNLSRRVRRPGFFRAWNFRFPAAAYLPATAAGPMSTADC